jgi:hypothetical protein
MYMGKSIWSVYTHTVPIHTTLVSAIQGSLSPSLNLNWRVKVEIVLTHLK